MKIDCTKFFLYSSLVHVARTDEKHGWYTNTDFTTAHPGVKRESRCPS